MIIWSIRSEDTDDPALPLTLNHVSISAEPMSAEGTADQDDIVEYRQPPSSAVYHPVIPFQRYLSSAIANAELPDSSSSNGHRRRKKDCGFPVLSTTSLPFQMHHIV